MLKTECRPMAGYNSMIYKVERLKRNRTVPLTIAWSWSWRIPLRQTWRQKMSCARYCEAVSEFGSGY
jgi:hypothetical protein